MALGDQIETFQFHKSGFGFTSPGATVGFYTFLVRAFPCHISFSCRQPLWCLF
ncbi:hypothetical protein PLICRDRAFT_202194 [Plicaturopsis crispa FD-325 SS-3]|nr:hypothetical protein PLICRDRAFT_202194 [Plicaturopsis crispa FD-325 SS-3]